MKKNIYITLVFILASCASGPKPAPDWVNHLSEDTRYFQGVGLSSLSSDKYRENAFQAAEREISRQLNVDIKSSSRREKVVELSKTVKDRYNDYVQTDIQQSLKEVKKIGEYQDNENYYVLLGLNKETYYQRKLDEKEQVLEEVQNMIHQLKSLDIDKQLSVLNKALGRLIEKDLLHEMDKNNDYIFNHIVSRMKDRLNQISLDVAEPILMYNPLLQRKLTVPLSIKYKGRFSKALPITIIINDQNIQNTLSNNRSVTELIVAPDQHEEQVVRIMLNDDVFGNENELFIDADLDLGSFLIRPVIGDVDISIHGPLSRNQKQRIKNSVEQYLLKNYKYDNSVKEKTKVNLTLERSDNKRYDDNFPYFSYCSGSVEIKTDKSINALKIKRYKGADFNSIDKAFDASIHELCKEQNMSMIFINQQKKG